MKKRFSKLMALGLAAVMMTGALTGCGEQGTNQAGTAGNQDGTERVAETAGTGNELEEEAPKLDISEEVELIMYVIGNEPAKQQEITDNMNAIFKEKLNCTLKINYIGFAEFANKYPLLFSSGEQFDMAYTATWLNFASLAQRGAFMALDELWPVYAPNNYAKTSESAKRQATVNGQIYCIPTLLPTYAVWGPSYRTDLLEGTDWDGEMETFDDLEEYLSLIKENAPGVEPLDICSSGSDMDMAWLQSQNMMNLGGDLWIDVTQEQPVVKALYEIESIPEFLTMMGRWNEKGFFSKSALSDTDTEKILNGKAAMKIHNVDTYSRLAISCPDYSFGFKNMVSSVSMNPFTQDAMIISNTSENPERALALWDLITSDQEAFDAFYYGIQGVSYEVNEEGQYRILDTDNYASSSMFAARTEGLNRDPEGTPVDVKEMKEEWNASITDGEGAQKYQGFVFDTSAIETEYAACTSVNQQYWWPLELGYTDSESGLAEYQKKMEAAGIDKVKTELQRQLDAYLADLDQ